MAAEKADQGDPIAILHQRDQPVVIRLDIEHDAPAFQDAGFGMRTLHVHGGTPLRAFGDSAPGIVLRTSGPNAAAAGVDRKVALDDVRADHEHSQTIAGIPENGRGNSRIVNLGAAPRVVPPAVPRCFVERGPYRTLSRVAPAQSLAFRAGSSRLSNAPGTA